MSSESQERERKRRIREKIRNLKNERKIYQDYKEDFQDGKRKFSKAYNGIQHLKGAQYNKVTSNCEDAIGNEEELLDALQIKNINMDKMVEEIISEVDKGINAIQDKIDDINSEIRSLESQL